jgi:hypothetical protein
MHLQFHILMRGDNLTTICHLFNFIGKHPLHKNSTDKMPQNSGIISKVKALKHKITHSRTYHVIQSMLSYVALATMLGSLSVLQNPPIFQPGIKQATAFNGGVPAVNELFNLLRDASTNTQLANTSYIFAFMNGKSAVRVCTDLEESDFESTVAGIAYFKDWDELGSDEILSFGQNGCSNISKLAYNSGCRKKGNPYYDKDSLGAIKEIPLKNFPGIFACGQPGDSDKLFSRPIPNGWLWKYQIRKIIALNGESELGTNITNCTGVYANICQQHKCQFDDCYDQSATCMGFKEFPTCSEAFPMISQRSCTAKITPRESLNGYCDCGNGIKRWKCGGSSSALYKMEDFSCKDVCKCESRNTTSCSGAGRKQCSCNQILIPGDSQKPEWIKNNTHLKDDKCMFGFGVIEGQENVFCEGKTVLSYGRQTAWIVALFIFGATFRIIYQLLCLYWSCHEDNIQYRILFSSMTMIRVYSLCKFGIDKLNQAIDEEYVQGWPWLLGLIDSFCVAIATLGVAYGADPFPELSENRWTLLLLWISAIRECLKLSASLFTTVSKKQWIVRGESRNVEIGQRTVPWCCVGDDIVPKKEPKTEVILPEAPQTNKEPNSEVDLHEAPQTNKTPQIAGSSPYIVQQTVIQVTIPQGVQAGSMMKITTPDGRTVDIQVPANAIPGTVISVSV